MSGESREQRASRALTEQVLKQGRTRRWWEVSDGLVTVVVSDGEAETRVDLQGRPANLSPSTSGLPRRRQ